MKIRIFAVLAALMLVMTFLCSCGNNDVADNGANGNDDTVSQEMLIEPGDDATKLTWQNAEGAYVTQNNGIVLTLTDASDDVNVYYDVEFYDTATETTLISVESCGDITEDNVLRVNVSESDMIALSIVDTEDDMSCIEVTGTYGGSDFAGNGTYYIVAG